MKRSFYVAGLFALTLLVSGCSSNGSYSTYYSVEHRYGYGPGWGYGWGGSYYPAVPIGPPIYSGPSNLPMFEEDN